MVLLGVQLCLLIRPKKSILSSYILVEGKLYEDSTSIKAKIAVKNSKVRETILSCQKCQCWMRCFEIFTKEIFPNAALKKTFSQKSKKKSHRSCLQEQR